MSRRRNLLLLVVIAAAGVAAVAATQLGGDDDAPEAKPAEVKALSNSNRTATIWAVGDGADGDQRSRDVARVIARSRPDRLLYLGDVYDTGTADEFESQLPHRVWALRSHHRSHARQPRLAQPRGGLRPLLEEGQPAPAAQPPLVLVQDSRLGVPEPQLRRADMPRGPAECGGPRGRSASPGHAASRSGTAPS